MIKIAFLVHSLRAGGIERSITRTINGLDAAQFEPIIICLDRTGPAERWLLRDVPIVELRKRSGNDLLAARRLAACLREQRIDLVQSHNWGTLVECVLARKLAGTPYHIHAERGTVLGMAEGRGWRYRTRGQVMMVALRTVDRVISNAHAVARRVQDRCGFPAARVQIIPNGVPLIQVVARTNTRRKIREQLGISQDAFLIGSVGRLSHVKGFDLAIQAFAKIPLGKPEVHLLFVGDGPEASTLAQLAENVGVRSRVHFVGRRDRIDDWLIAMDLYVNSSRSEGMSQSIVEAMSAGLSIVATDVGDNARLIARPELPCGLVCPSQCVHSLAESMRFLVNSAPQRESFSQHATHCHAKFYSESALIATVEKLYRDVVTEQRIACSTALSVPTQASSR